MLPPRSEGMPLMTSHLPLDVGTAEQVDMFILDLRRVRRRSGEPSYRTLSRCMGYSVATINRSLNGASLPSWGFAKAFLLACDTDEPTLRQWRERWARIAELIDPLHTEDLPDLPDPRQPYHPAPAVECHDCGALIANVQRHREWHARLDYRTRRKLRTVS